MKPEELVNIANNELAKREQKEIDNVVNTIYGTFKEFIKAGYEYKSINILAQIVFTGCNKYKNSSQIFDSVVKRLKKDGYYVINGHAYISRDAFKKALKKDIGILIWFALFCFVVFLYTVYRL